MSAPIFVDTNILVYAHDASAGAKQKRASALLEDLWDTRDGCVSVQILQEFFVTVTRSSPLAIEARACETSQGCDSRTARANRPKSRSTR